MSKQANARQRRATEAMKRHQQRRILDGVFGLAGLLAAVAIVLLVTGGGEKNQTASSQQPSAAPATWSAEVYTGGARLAVDKTSVDEGSVAYGHEVQARFRLRNVGDQPMTLGTAEVKTLEGC